MIGACKASPQHVVPSDRRECERCGETVLCTHRTVIGTCSECAREACARGQHVRSGHTATSGWVASRCIYCGATDGTVAGDPQCPHGKRSACTQCMSELYGRAQTVTVLQPSTTDARALLWARTYHWGLRRYYLEANTRGLAVAAANNAVCDFDEHYCTKGTL